MIHTDRNAVICDLAETYGIYDMGSLPARTVAILASGLRENSRIKMKLTGAKTTNEIILLAQAVDRLSLLVWKDTKDGQHNRHRPESIAERILFGDPKKKTVGDAFDSVEEFEAARARLLERS